LHGDAADGDERRMTEVNIVRYCHDVVQGRGGYLGMARGGARHGLADLDALDV
jgi:hypothetical protein